MCSLFLSEISFQRNIKLPYSWNRDVSFVGRSWYHIWLIILFVIIVCLSGRKEIRLISFTREEQYFTFLSYSLSPMTQTSLRNKVSAKSDSFREYFVGNSIRWNRFHEIGETEDTAGLWWLRGEASRRQGRGGWMQIPEFLCRPWRSGYLAVQRIKVAVFTIGNADRAAIVLPYKRPPGYRRTGLSSLNTTIVVRFFATRITNVHRVTIRYFVSIARTS